MSERLVPYTNDTIRAVTSFLDIPNPNLPLKLAKDAVIHELDFTSLSSVLSKFSSFTSDTVQQVPDHVMNAVSSNERVTLRLIDDNGKKGGGYPIVHITSPSELYKLTTTTGDTIYARAESGDSVRLQEFNLIQAFSRRNSAIFPMGNFDNPLPFVGQTLFEEVKLGGGFRIQADDLREEDGILNCNFTATVVYNDAPPRETSLATRQSRNIPHVTIPFGTEYTEKKLTPAMPSRGLQEVLSRRDAVLFGYHLLHTVFTQDAQPITNLLGALLTVDPNLKKHSLEGIWTTQIDVNGIPELLFEIIDFDGADTMQAWMKGKMLPPSTNLNAINLFTQRHVQALISPWSKDIAERKSQKM